jgi:hypothetical protein
MNRKVGGRILTWNQLGGGYELRRLTRGIRWVSNGYKNISLEFEKFIA